MLARLLAAADPRLRAWVADHALEVDALLDGCLYGLGAQLAAKNTIGMSPIERSFWRFHTQNQHAYAVMVGFAREARRRGVKHIGMRGLIEEARSASIQTVRTSRYKICNAYSPYYARLIMLREPDLADVFVLHKLRWPPTFGPRNDALPSNPGNSAPDPENDVGEWEDGELTEDDESALDYPPAPG